MDRPAASEDDRPVQRGSDAAARMIEQEAHYRSVFQRAHADHVACLADEWLNESCRSASGRTEARPLVWSRRNGAWRRVTVLWVGAAPGNAGGRGSGALGAHGTRIPFGGDIAGGNLDVLLSSIGLSRNNTFIVAALNQLPARGGGEPSMREIAEPVGAYPDSIALLRDTIVAAGPTLIVALGNVALRALAAAITRTADAPAPLPSLARLGTAGFERGRAVLWPDTILPMARGLRAAWSAAWHEPPAFHVLPLLHPSAQNMSPFAGVHTQFHQRMLQTRLALGAAAHQVLGWDLPVVRPEPPRGGIYDLPEWRDRIAGEHRRYDKLWRAQGV